MKLLLPLLAAAAFASSARAATAAKMEPSYTGVDVVLRDIDKAVAALGECVAVSEFLADSSAKTAKRVTAPNGAIPSHMAGIVPIKRKMADDKRAACIAQGNALGSQFDAAMLQLASLEPRSAKGVLARRASLKVQRNKANAHMARLGAKTPKASSDDKEKEGGEGSEPAAP